MDIEAAKLKIIEDITAGLDESVIGGPLTSAQIMAAEDRLSDSLSATASEVLGRPVRIRVSVE